MKMNGKKMLFGLLLALPAMAPFAMAGSFTGPTNAILPAVVNTGGQDGTSANHNLTGVIDEPGQAAYTSANNILEPGFANLVAWPERITDIFASTGAAEGSLQLKWTSPKADGYTGTVAAYEIRLSSVPARSPAISESQFLQADSAAGFVTVPAPSAYGSAEQLNVTGLVGGATYYVAVKARASWDAWSYLSNGATAQARLYAPAFSNFTNVYVSSVQFNWTVNGNAPGMLYRVLVSTAADPLNPAGAVVTSSDTYNLYLTTSGLNANTVYYFRAAGVNSASGVANYSAAAGTSTLVAYAPVFGSFSDLDAGVVRVNWSANGNPNPGTQYQVLASTAPDPLNPAGADVAVAYSGGVFLDVSGLDANTTYYFRVAGVNNDGVTTSYTAAQATSTLANMPAFAGFTNVGPVAAQFNWSANGNPDGTLYRVVMSTAPDPLTPGGAPVTSSDTYNMYLSSSGLTSDTDYYFRAAAINNNGVITSYLAPRKVSTVHVTAPVFQGAGTAVGGAAAVYPAWPTHQTDDIALLFIESTGGQAANLNPANGFVQVPNSPQYTGTGTAGTRLTVYWARATSAAMPAPTVTDPGNHAYAVILTFRNVVNTGDPWDDTSGGVKAAASASVTIPGVNTTTPGTLVVAGLTKDLDSTASFTSNWTNSNLTDITVNADAGTTSGNGGGIAVMTGSMAQAGATGNTIVDVTSSVNAFITIALKPKPPLSPPNISAVTGVGARYMTASWQPVSGAIGYTLAASLAPDNPPAIYASSTTAGLSATVDTPVLNPNTTYYLFVRAASPDQTSAWSAFLGTSTLVEYDPLAAGFSGVSAASIQFNWSNNGNPLGTTRYRVYVSTAPDPLTPDGAVVTSSDTYNLFLSSSGLDANTNYYFRAAGLNNNSVSTGYSSPVATSTLLAYPPAFSGFTGISTGSLRINWSGNGNAAGTLYRALISTSSDMSPAVSSDTYNTFLSSAGLAANATYYFSVSGVNRNGVQTASVGASTSTWARMPVLSGFTAVDSGMVQLGWSADGSRYPGTLYRVAVSTAPDPLNPGGALATYSDTAALSISTSGLAANTTYYFRAAAINNNGVLSGYTAALATSTLLAYIPASGGFTNVYASSVQFNWSANGNAYPGTQFRVLVSTAADPLAPAGALVTSSNTYSLSLSSSGLAANTTYYFRVAGVNNNNVLTGYSVRQGTSTLLAYTPVFSNFTGVGTGAIQFNWSANGNAPAVTLYRVAASTATDPLNPAGAVVTSSDTYNVSLVSSGLDPNTTYYFSVAGVNNNGVRTAYTAAKGTSTLAALPSGFDFPFISSTTLRLSWSSSGNGPGTRYSVLTSTAADPQAPAGAVVTTSGTYNAFLSTSGLHAGTDYFFRAAAINNNGVYTSYSAIVTTKTLAVGVLAAPLAGSFTAYASSITANWTLVGGATGYTLAVSVNPGVSPSPILTSSTTLINTSAYVQGLAADTVYYLFVKANGDGVSSAWSNYSPVATLLANPPAFSNFANVGTNAADFVWSANGNAPLVTKYRVLVSTAADPLAPAGAAVTSSDTYNVSLSSSGLASDTTYYFRAAGINKDGAATAYTAVQATATWANAPVFSNFTNVGAAAIQFNWSANGNPYPKTLYRVKVSTAADPLAPAGAVVTSSDTYNISLNASGLAANATYYFRVAGLGVNSSTTAYTAPVGTSTLLAAAPVFTNFTSVGAAAIQYNWSANGNAPAVTKYRVLVSTAPDPLNPAGAVVTSSDTYNISLSSSALAANTTYYFSAAGVNNNNVLTSYAAAAGTATLANIPLTAVSTFSAVTDSGFTVSWKNNSNPMPGTLYIVQASTAQDFNSGAADQVTASTSPAAGPSYAFTGLNFNTTYYVQVRAVNQNGVRTGYASLGSTTTLTIQSPAIGAITGVQTNAISANWQLVGGATGYTLAASMYPDNPPSPVSASSTTLGDLSATLNIPALHPNTTYYLFVRANGPGLSSLWSAYTATSTLANAPMTAVPAFGDIGFNSFRVNWDNNSNPLPGTQYTVQASTAYDYNSGVTDMVTLTTAPEAGPGALLEALNSGVYYYVRVRAVGNGGNIGPWTDLGVVKTKTLPTIHLPGDGVIFYGQAGNAVPQFRSYSGANNTFGPVSAEPPSGEEGTLYSIKTSPLTTKQEAVAAYVKDSTLHVLCTDGTNWSEEWTQAIGGTASTRRFNIAYETNSGDVLVLYSQGQGGSNELGYRTKPGSADCGAGNWTGNTNLTTQRTTGEVQWVKMATDHRAASDNIAAIWADANSNLSARIWNGTDWENEAGAGTTPLEASLEVVSTHQDVEDFDVAFESLSGNAMVVWANSAGSNGTNGLRYARWLEATRTWSAATNPTTSGDDATNLDLSPNPDSNEMVVASIGNAGSDLRGAYWSGSAWTISALDTSCQLPLAGTRFVAVGWISSGTYTHSIIAYNKKNTTNMGWYMGTGANFTLQTPQAFVPAFGTPQDIYNLHEDPVNKDRLMLTVSDDRPYLFAKRLIMNSAGSFAWSDANGGAELETNLAAGPIGGFSFAYWPAPPSTTLSQSSYRFFANTASADVGAPLATQDTLAELPSAGAAFRLRALVHIGQVDLPQGGQAFKLQYAGMGDGTCDAPADGVPASYTDVTAGTLLAFNDNAGVSDGVPLTANVNDPRHGGLASRNQTYEEANNFANSVSAIARNQEGVWDFALKDNGMVPGAAYCLRIVKADGSVLNSYDQYPTVIRPAPVQVNEVYPGGATAAEDWVELYNNTGSAASLVGWRLDYTENTLDLGGTPNTVWTGQPGEMISAMSTFTITTLSMDLKGSLSYNVKLYNNAGTLVDQVQWPSLSAGQSFARITDGNPSFFEIDPTPTKGYANHVTTDALKINEVSYGPLNTQFVEIYNTSLVSTRTLSGYSLRNFAASANGLKFKFTRIIYPQNYAVLDFSSLSDDALSYTGVFGPQGLSAAGDFLALEDPAGSMVDNVTWQSDVNYSRYNYRADPVSFVTFAPANTGSSIMRQPAEGSDTGNNAADFVSSVYSTLGSRNNNAGTALPANTLTYPVKTGSPQFLARKFPLTFQLGVLSSTFSANNVIFERTGGNADARSPHLLRLQDLGLNLQTLLAQTTVQSVPALRDQDGYPLVASATYRVTFNTDTGSQSAPQIILGTVTLDASIHYVSGVSNAPQNQNNAVRGSAIRLDISNNSPAGFNSLEVTTVTFRIMNPDLLAPFSTVRAQKLFNAIMLVRDSTSTGVAGTYEAAIDVSTIAYVPMSSISLDPVTGFSTLTVVSPDLLSASIPAGSTTTFYLVFEATENASGWEPDNVFRVSFDPSSGVAVRDGPSDLREDFTGAAQLDTSSTTIIAPAQRPAGTFWPYVPPSGAAVGTPAGVTYLSETFATYAVYMASDDGYLRAINRDGTLKWSFATDSRTPIRTSPMPVEEADGVYVYFADDNGDIYKVQDNNSAPLGPKWKKSIGVPVRSSLMCTDQVCSGDVFYFGAADNKVRCMNKSDGSPCAGWNYASAITAPIAGMMSIDARATINTGWTGLEDGKMVSFKTGDGTSNTVFQTGGAIKSSPYLDAAYSAANNNLYFTSTDHKLYSRTSANLTAIPTNWADYDSGAAIYTSPWVADGPTKYVFFGDDEGRLRKVDATYGGSLPAAWTFQAGGAIRSSPIVVGGYVYFGCDDGYIYSISADTGLLRTGWPVATGGPVRADPVTDGNRLVIGSNDGKTYVLDIAP